LALSLAPAELPPSGAVRCTGHEAMGPGAAGEEAALLHAEKGLSARDLPLSARDLPTGQLRPPSSWPRWPAGATWARRWHLAPAALLVASACCCAAAWLRWGPQTPLSVAAARTTQLSQLDALKREWPSFAGFDMVGHDVAHLDADDLDEVRRRCLEEHCVAFTVNLGVAWLKGHTVPLKKGDLHYIGGDGVKFYVRPEAAEGLKGLKPPPTPEGPPVFDVSELAGTAPVRDAAQPRVEALLCSGPSACGPREGLRRWRVSPPALAKKVGDLSKLPGVGRATYAAVRDRWLAAPPLFGGSPVMLKEIASFAAEVLSNDPFGTGDEVPYVDLGPASMGKVVAITQRQLAFLVANVLMNNTVDGGDGLSAALVRCTGLQLDYTTTSTTTTMAPTSTSTTTMSATRTTTTTTHTNHTQQGGMDGFMGDWLGHILWPNGGQADGGEEIEVRKLASSETVGATDIVHSLLSLLAVLARELADGRPGTMLIAASPGDYSDAWRAKLDSPLLPPEPCMKVPGWKDTCETPDFMSGGVKFQAVTDIAGGVVGGGASLCTHANSQDESLVQFYSEVLALAFFVPGWRGGMLSVPMTVLGARRYVNDLTGESMYGSCGTLPDVNWLNANIPTATTGVPLQGRQVTVAASAFVAVASLSTDSVVVGKCSVDDLVNNNCDAQRRHLDDDIARWYQAYEPTMYHGSVQDAVRGVIRRIGTGPWGAGLWHGDSQQYFLATWLATALISGGKVGLDYYIYDKFCENGGNQCFVLGSSAGCAGCIAQGGNLVNPGRCGTENIWGVIGRLKGKPASVLYNALKDAPGPPVQLFDGLKV